MSKYNITVISMVKTSSTSYTGRFSLTDNDIMVNGKACSATVVGEVETIMWNGGTIAKIKGTQGQRLGVPTRGWVGEQEVQVVWLQGHRGAVAAAFAALWTKMSASGETEIKDVQNPSGRGRTGGVVMMAPTVDTSKVDALEAQLKASQEAQLRMEAMMMAMMERLAQQAAEAPKAETTKPAATPTKK
jgi:hypothetical protein